jgi:Effector Associated Constant Component 1
MHETRLSCSSWIVGRIDTGLQAAEGYNHDMLGGDTQVRISLIAGDYSDLESLEDWLRRERELAGRVMAAVGRPREGELGVPAEALIVAVSSGGVLSVLAGALKAWVSLPRRSDVRIKIQGAEGRVVEIAADRVCDSRVDDLLRQALGYKVPGE